MTLHLIRLRIFVRSFRVLNGRKRRSSIFPKKSKISKIKNLKNLETWHYTLLFFKKSCDHFEYWTVENGEVRFFQKSQEVSFSAFFRPPDVAQSWNFHNPRISSSSIIDNIRKFSVREKDGVKPSFCVIRHEKQSNFACSPAEKKLFRIYGYGIW